MRMIRAQGGSNSLIDSKNPELDFERIQILYASVKAGYVGVASAIIMLYLIAARYSSPETAGWWLLAVGISNIPRIVTSVQFSRKMKTGVITAGNIGPWDRYMSISSVIAYSGFVSVIYLPFGDNAVIGTVLCAFVFMVMATGGVLVLSTSFTQILTFLTLVMFSIIGKLVLLQETLYYIIAVILAIGYLQLLVYARNQNRTLIENIALKIENKQSALIDPLTRLGNRRRLALYTEKLVPTSQRSGEPFCLIILDIDYFKKYNDTRGHSAGDELLTRVARALQECSRDQDLVVRYGGEEFLVVLPQTALNDAAKIAGRILATVRGKTAATVSAGVAEYAEDMSFEQLVAQADEALYAAKNGGRDQYVLAPTQLEVNHPIAASGSH